MYQVVLLIGGNLGDREQLIQEALLLLSDLGKIEKQSSIYETEAWGEGSKAGYLNQAVLIITDSPPTDFLRLTQEIENKLGRVRDKKWGDRTMDIDIIYVDDLVYQDENLIIPHPLIAERNFVLVPLVEILPDYIHPVFRISNRELLRRCKDERKVALHSGK